eukprot:9199940-Alexandrium_andersonii.AAC.1
MWYHMLQSSVARKAWRRSKGAAESHMLEGIKRRVAIARLHGRSMQGQQWTQVAEGTAER